VTRIVIAVVEEVEELGLTVDWVMVFQMGKNELWNERLRESGWYDEWAGQRLDDVYELKVKS